MELREQGLWVTDVVPFLRQGFDDQWDYFTRLGRKTHFHEKMWIRKPGCLLYSCRSSKGWTYGTLLFYDLSSESKESAWKAENELSEVLQKMPKSGPFLEVRLEPVIFYQATSRTYNQSSTVCYESSRPVSEWSSSENCCDQP